MPTFHLAHIKEQGVELMIIPLAQAFRHKTGADRSAILSELQRRATAAGLSGRVVPVWDSGGGQMSFLAPRNWRPFFQNISLSYVYQHLNRTLSW
jgi:hypothetical protein